MFLKKTIDMFFYVVKKKTREKGLYRSKKRIFNTLTSHVIIKKANNWNTSNSDNITVTSKLLHIKVQNYNSFNTLITLQK